MNYAKKLIKTGASETGWPAGSVRWLIYSDPMTCAQALAQFNALTDWPSRVAATTATDPNLGSERGCSQSGTGTGFTPSTYSRTVTDFAGHSFTATGAPSLLFVDQNKPRLSGNNYAFPVNTALNSPLFERIPKHSSRRILIYPGGLFNDPGDNDLIDRGWTHVSESVNFNQNPYPTEYKRALELANYALAYQAANDLPAGDPRRDVLLAWAGPLPAFEGDHLFINREDAAQLYAQYWYNYFKQSDVAGGGVEYFSVNHEVWKARNPANYVQEWYTHVGWITKHILNYAAADPDSKLKGSAMTDWGNLSHVSPYFFDDNDGATGYPRYMSWNYVMEPYRGSSQSQPIGNGNDMSNLILSGKAFVGVGRYMQHTMDNQTMFEKNGDGTIKTDGNGFPIWRTDKRITTIAGEQTVVYKDDYEWAMIKRYGMEASDYANWFMRAGSKHLPHSNDRGAGYQNLKFSGQFRLDTEIDTGNTSLGVGYNGLTSDEFGMLNHRPLNPDWTEDNAIRMYLNETYVRGWMQTQPRTALGSDLGSQGSSRASVEFYQKGFQRAANVSWIDDVGYYMVEPKLWLKNQGVVSNKDPNEHFARKPIIRPRITKYLNRWVMWLRAVWPCQDVDRITQVTVWVDKDGTKSPSYIFNMTGRQVYLDWFNLPVGFPDFEPKHIYLQFNTLLNETITWRGDYREARLTTNPTPPALFTS